MTIKDWFYLAITIVSYAITIIAGVYAKDKHRINRATRAGQVMDVIGQLATTAVHEAEYSGMDNQEKRELASDIISRGLAGFGIHNVSANVINGAIEKAVNSMHLANDDTPENDANLSDDVPEDDILDPKDVSANGK